MIRIAKFNTSFLSETRRIIKCFSRGQRDVSTNHQCSDWGDDSNPIQGSDIVVAETKSDETTLILGVIQTNKKANPGEKRIFATDEDGNTVIDIWLKADGTVEFDGTGDFLARFNELKAGFDQLKQDHNNLITAFNSHMHATAATGPPTGPTPIPNQIPATASTASIDNSKIDNLKTNSHGN